MGISQKRFTDQQIEQANNVNIIDYARSQGYNPIKISNSSYKIPGYGGLFISCDGRKWNWFSQNKGGGTIQFVMEMAGKSWVDSVKELLGIEHSENSYLHLKSSSKEVKEKLVLPERNDTYKHLFAYLIKTRHIDPEVVADLVDKKMLYEDRNRNCVFVGYNEKEEPAYASRRGTRTHKEAFRGDVKNSDKSYPFCLKGGSSALCVFEAPIDLMSYLSLLKVHGVKDFNHHLISLGGVAESALERYLKDNQDMDTIVLCLDNDKAGNAASQKIKEHYGARYKILRHRPNRKDFNEDLTRLKEGVKVRAREPPTTYGEDIEEEA